MTVSFNFTRHSVVPGRSIVEILIDGETAGVIYPMGEKGIKLVSAHFSDKSLDDNFAGEVVVDEGRSWPPIPALEVTFDPSPYTIVGDKIVRLPKK